MNDFWLTAQSGEINLLFLRVAGNNIQFSGGDYGKEQRKWKLSPSFATFSLVVLFGNSFFRGKFQFYKFIKTGKGWLKVIAHMEAPSIWLLTILWRCWKKRKLCPLISLVTLSLLVITELMNVRGPFLHEAHEA